MTLTNSPSDIVDTKGIVGQLPPSWRPYAILMRLDRPIGTWLLLLPCWWGLALNPAPALNMLTMMGLFAVGAILMRGAGCIINDMWDRDLDRQVERTRNRPLASKQLEMRQASLLLICILCFSLIILLSFNSPTILTGALSLLLVVTYPLMKRVTWWPQFFLGMTFNWGILMGSTATRGQITLETIILYAAGIVWTLGYDTIYAHQDIADDEIVGIKSTARLFGQNSRRWVSTFYGATILMILLAGAIAHMGILFYFGMAIGAAWIILFLRRWREDDPTNCLSRFKENRDFGLIVFLSITAGAI